MHGFIHSDDLHVRQDAPKVFEPLKEVYHIVIAIHLQHTPQEQMKELSTLTQVIRQTIVDLENERVVHFLNNRKRIADFLNDTDDFQEMYLSQSVASSQCTTSQPSTEFYDLELHDRWNYKLKQ